MKHTFNIPSPKSEWVYVAILLVLLSLVNVARAQEGEGSQGNTTIFGGAQMTFFDNHTFITPPAGAAGGTQPGVILTERATGTISYLNFKGINLTSTGVTNVSHVDGYVRRIGTGKFVFPVGDNGFAGQFAADADGTNGAYFHADPNVAVTSNLFTGTSYPVLPAGGIPAFPRANKQAKIGEIDQVEYWDINGTNSTPITLSWDAGSGVAAMTSSTISRLTIVGWNPATSTWVNIPSTLDVIDVTTGMATGLTAGSITTTASIVPDTYTVYTLAGVVPDLTPSLRIAPSQVVNTGTLGVRVVVAEINSVQTAGAIYVTIPVSAHYVVNTYNPSLPSIGGQPVQNSNWSYLGIFSGAHIFQYGGTAGVTSIAASASSAFGFFITYTTNTQAGTENVVVSVFDNSGGEINLLNNKDNETINFSSTL